jgi:hypothetical protein
MGKAVIIILLSGILIFGIVSIQVNRSTSDVSQKTSDYYRDIYTRNIANSMLDILKTKLLEDTTYRVANFQTAQILGGNVIYKLIDTNFNSNRYIKAVVIANYEGMSKKSEAYFTIEKLGSGGIPAFLRYAVVSGSNLNLNGGINITNAGNGLNANVHVNGNFSMNGDNFIGGFLTYTGSASSNPSNFLQRNIRPVSNPDNLPVHYQTQRLEIPEFDPNDVRSKATEIYYGNKTFNGNVVLGTQQNPKIIFVTGDLTINGNVSGYGIFVSLGRTIINGSVTLSTPGIEVSPVGIYSGGELIVNGNVTLNAQIFSNDRITLNGNPKIYGNVVSKSSILMNGNVSVYYKPANEELTKPLWPVSSSGNIVQVRTVYFYE